MGESKVIYKHTLFLNVNNRVVSHSKEISHDNIKPDSDEAYTVKYNKVSELFRVVIYNYDKFESQTNDYVSKTFRQRCNTITNCLSTTVLSKKEFSEV